MKQLLYKCLSLLIIAVLEFPIPVSALTNEQIRVQEGGSHYFNVEDISVCSNLSIANGSVDRFLQVLAYQESRGDPTARSTTSSASGKYQYIDGTWKARSSIYGPSRSYARAYLAPEEVQDAVAYIEYTQKFKDLSNDLFKLAVSHFLPAANSNPPLLDKTPSGNNITPRQYADRLIQNIGTGVGADIPLKHTQAPEYEEWITKVGGPPPSVNAGADTGGCSSFATGATIVKIAREEMATGAKTEDNSYHKYTNGVDAEWCAYFISWVLEKAGKPFEDGVKPTAASILAYAQNKGYYHAKGETGFTPQPGDIAIYKENIPPYPSHVNIVISYNPSTNQYASIGGNESGTILEATWDANLTALTGFMRLP